MKRHTLISIMAAISTLLSTAIVYGQAYEPPRTTDGKPNLPAQRSGYFEQRRYHQVDYRSTGPGRLLLQA